MATILLRDLDGEIGADEVVLLTVLRASSSGLATCRGIVVEFTPGVATGLEFSTFWG